MSCSLKRFFLWLHEGGYTAPWLQIEKVRRIKPHSYQPTTKTSEDLLTEDEILLLIEHANSARNRVIIAMETGTVH